MKQKVIIGVDVSKCTLDLCIKPFGITLKVSNDLEGFTLMKQQIVEGSQVMVVMEHTGMYSANLEAFLCQNDIAFCKLPALEIKRSGGMVRGKSDKVDAVRIAEYGWLRKDQLKATVVVTPEIICLRQMIQLRAKLVKDRSGYLSRVKESNVISLRCTMADKVHQAVIKTFTSEIKKLDTAIQKHIAEHAELARNFTLLRSIKGVGAIVAASMIASTGNFTQFTNPRKFNCYAGVAPFKHESGTSIRSRSRVSHLANKQIKTLLSLSAFCAIRCNQELKEYYLKRVAEGKAKMSCLNIIRAKLVTRMFAVVKRQSPYHQIPIAA